MIDGSIKVGIVSVIIIILGKSSVEVVGMFVII